MYPFILLLGIPLHSLFVSMAGSGSVLRRDISSGLLFVEVGPPLRAVVVCAVVFLVLAFRVSLAAAVANGVPFIASGVPSTSIVTAFLVIFVAVFVAVDVFSAHCAVVAIFAGIGEVNFYAACVFCCRCYRGVSSAEEGCFSFALSRQRTLSLSLYSQSWQHGSYPSTDKCNFVLSSR